MTIPELAERIEERLAELQEEIARLQAADEALAATRNTDAAAEPAADPRAPEPMEPTLQLPVLDRATLRRSPDSRRSPRCEAGRRAGARPRAGRRAAQAPLIRAASPWHSACSLDQRRPSEGSPTPNAQAGASDVGPAVRRRSAAADRKRKRGGGDDVARVLSPAWTDTCDCGSGDHETVGPAHKRQRRHSDDTVLHKAVGTGERLTALRRLSIDSGDDGGGVRVIATLVRSCRSRCRGPDRHCTSGGDHGGAGGVLSIREHKRSFAVQVAEARTAAYGSSYPSIAGGGTCEDANSLPGGIRLSRSVSQFR